MRRTILSILFATLALTACGSSDSPATEPTPDPGTTTGREPVTDFVRGADISWYTEMHDTGKKFYNAKGEERSCPQLMKEIGMNAVRLRVWVNPRNRDCNYCDQQDVVNKAAAAWQSGLNVMIDFHLSDWWADPGRQDMPAAWASMSHEQLKAAVAQHVGEVLRAIKQQGVEVAWVQIGNETRNGMMHPDGQLWNDQGRLDGGFKRFAELYMAGYDAAKAVYPEAKVMPHLNHAYEDNAWWVKELKENGGKLDMIALSHYPQADDATKSWSTMNQLAEANIRSLAKTFGVPVVVAEFGVSQTVIAQSAPIAADFMKRMRQLGTSVCAGVYYWEPEVYGGWKPASYTGYGWGAYTSGAFTAAGQPSGILDSWQNK